MTEALSKLVIQVTGDTEGGEQALARLQSEVAATDQSMQRVGASAAQMGQGIDRAGGNAKALASDLANLKSRLAELQQIKLTLGEGAAAQLDVPIRQTTAEIAKLEAQIKGLAPAAQASFLSTVSSVDDLRQHLQQLQAVQARGNAQGLFTPGLAQEIDRTNTALQSIDGSAKGFGSTIEATTTRLFTHLLVYKAISDGVQEVTKVWSEGIEAASGYQMALLKVDALTVGGAADTRRYSQEIVQMSQRFPASAKEMGDALFFIESHGIKGAAAMDLLKQSALANEAGLGKTSDIARIAAGSVEAYGEKNLSAARAVDILTAGVKEGSLAPETLANSLGKVVGIAAHMGISFEEVIANIATLTRQSVPAAQATTDLSSVMTGLNHPSHEATMALAGLGMSAEDLRKSIRDNGLLATLEMLEARTGGNTEVIQTLLPNVRALRDMYGVTGAQAQQYAETLQHVKDSQGATQTAADEMSQAYENQQKVLTNNWEALVIGLNILPGLSAVTEGLTNKVREQTEEMNRNQEARRVTEALVQHSSSPFGNDFGGMTDKILADAKILGMSYSQLNDELAKMTVPADFIAKMDHLAMIAGLDKPGHTGPVPPLIGPSPNEQGTNPPGASYDFEAARRQAQQIAEMGSEARSLRTAAEKLQAAEFTQGLPDPGKIEQSKAALLTAAAEVEAGWRKVLSPEEFARRSAELDAIVNGLAQSVNGATDSQIAEMDALLARYGAQSAAAAKAKHDAEEAKRAANETERARKQTSIYGFDTEGTRLAVTQTWGKLGGDSVMALTEGLSDPTHMASAGQALRKSIGELTKLLRENGIPEWEQLGIDLANAGRQALLGQISEGDFQEQLRAAIEKLPKINADTIFNPETFRAGALRGDMPSALASLGDLLQKQIEEGGHSTQAQVERFQRDIGASLKQTEKIKDPETVAAFAQSFADIVTEGMASGTPDGVRAMTEGLASWARQVDLAAATEELNRKVDEAQKDFERKVLESARTMAQSVKNSFQTIFAERGTIGEGAVNIDAIKAEFQKQAGRGEPVLDALGVDKLPEATRQMLALIDNTNTQLTGEYGKGLRDQREDLQRQLDERLRIVQEGQRKETDAFQQGIEDRRRAEAHSRQDSDATLNRSRSAEDLAKQRLRQDAAEQRQLSQQLADAQKRGAKPEELAQINSSFSRQQAEEQIRRDEEDKDRVIAASREAADRQTAAAREAQDVATQRSDKVAQEAMAERQRIETRNQQLDNEMASRRFGDTQANLELARQLVTLVRTNAETLVTAARERAKAETEAQTAFEKFSAEPPWMAGFIESVNHFTDIFQANVPSGIVPAGFGFGGEVHVHIHGDINGAPEDLPDEIGTIVMNKLSAAAGARSGTTGAEPSIG